MLWGHFTPGLLWGGDLITVGRTLRVYFWEPDGGGVEELKAIVYFGTQRVGVILMVIGVNVAKCHKK